MSLTKASYSMITGSPVNIMDFGAACNGVSDDTAAIQAAVNAGNVIEFPYGNTLISSTITVTGNKTLIIRGTLKPFSNAGSAGTPMIQIAGSNVKIKFEGGGIDGISATYSNWAGIYATFASRLSNIEVVDGLFQNIGINNTSAYVINLDGVNYGNVSNNTITNCGVIGNVVGGGHGIYLQFCVNTSVTQNKLFMVGSTSINNSAGVSNIISNNNVQKATLFGFKGGYAPNITTVTNDIARTVSSFSVAATASAIKNMVQGASVCIFNAAPVAPVGFIGQVVNNGTYLTINLTGPMDAVPENGVQVQLLETGTVYDANTLIYSGDNGWDINGWSNITVTGNSLVSPGAYTDAGSFGGLAAGFWFGYDQQGAYTGMASSGLTISGNTVKNAYGSAISVMSVANDVSITSNTLTQYNRSNNAAFGGIDLTRLTFNRSKNHVVSGNTCISIFGYGIYTSFSTNVVVTNNYINSSLGIVANSQNICNIQGNTVTTVLAGASGYGILVSDTSTVNASSTITVMNNWVYIAGQIGISVTDANALEVTIKDNTSFGSSATMAPIYDTSVGNDLITVGGYNGRGLDGFMRIQVPVGVTVKLSDYASDAGTIGGVIIEGFIRTTTTAFEWFSVAYYGNTAMPTVAFTSNGSPNATAFLAAGDFTTTVNSPSAGRVTCNYKNNEAGIVFLSLKVASLGRF